jgi:hypothetical protein
MVTKGGSVEADLAEGLADAEAGVPCTSATAFQVCSVSKQFTDGYGMYTGIFVGHAACFHPGDNPGYQSLACWIPDQTASIVILVNDEAASITGLLRQLLPAAL